MKTMAYLRPPRGLTGRFLIALTLACCLTGGASATAGLRPDPNRSHSHAPSRPRRRVYRPSLHRHSFLRLSLRPRSSSERRADLLERRKGRRGRPAGQP